MFACSLPTSSGDSTSAHRIVPGGYMSGSEVKYTEHKARKKIKMKIFFWLQTLVVGNFMSNHLTTFSQNAGAKSAHHWE